MKNLLASFACFLSIAAYSTTYYGADANKLVSGADKVVVDDDLHTISFVHFSSKPASGDHISWLRNLLKAGAETGFVLYETKTDQLGWTHYRYRQLYKNVQVENGVFYVHVRDGEILSANGEFYSGIDLSVTPSYNETAAKATALNALQAKKLAPAEQLQPSSLVIFRNDKNQFHLTWKVDAFSLAPMQRFWYFVNANTGKIEGKEGRLCEIDSPGFALTGHNGAQAITTDSLGPANFRLQESGRNIQTHTPSGDITDTDNYWSSTSNLDQYAYDAHWGAEKTVDFYNAFGLNGQDGNGL
ncbi:MAG TPA: hypothetical protein VI731_00395, partial [Bacteroidia bacterium]|nr:hypothetical protein [Bacteroidia bacterium]